MKKYVFRKYDPNYINYFAKEKSSLKKVLPRNAIIEHIGSTSVPGLGGKGIIDILVAVDGANIDKTKHELMKNKYLLNLRGGNNKRIFFEKFNKRRWFHLHLVDKKSGELKLATKFRDHLRNDKKTREEYVIIKKKALKFAKGEGAKYRKYKNKFIEKIVNRK